MGGALPCRQLIEAREGLKGWEITNHSQQGCAKRLKFTADAMYSLYCFMEEFCCLRDNDAVAESRFRYICR